MHKIFNLRTFLNFLYITLIVISFLFVPYHNIRTGFTSWDFTGLTGAKGPVNAAALAVQRALTFVLVVFYIYNARLKRKIRYENKEIDMAIRETEERRHRIEREYFRLKRQMQNIFDNMDDLVLICSKDYKVEFMNRSSKLAFGEGLGKKCYEVLYKFQEPCQWCYSERVLNGENITCEQKHEINNKVYKISCSPLTNPDASVSIIFVFHDITKEKVVEEKLESSEEYFRNLFENLPVACFGYDKEAKIVAWNNTAAGLYGFKKEDVLGRSMFETIAQNKDYQSTMYYVKEVFSGKSFDAIEWEDRTAEGKLRYVLTNTYPLYNIQGEIIMGISANVDITVRKTIEDDLRFSKEHLEKIMEAQDRYRVFLESIPMHVGMIDATGKFVIWNKYSEQMFGYTKEEVLGKMSPKYLHETEKEAKEVIETAAQKGIFDRELNLIHKNGSKIPARLVVVPIKEQDKIAGFYGFAEDISKTRKTENELLITKEKLESLALKDSLTELYNNHYVSERLGSEFERAKRSFSSLSLLLMDLDYFKSINDKYGHDFGDKILIQTAKLLKTELRANDIIARWGGEEFMVILPEVNREGAIVVAKKLHRAFRVKGFGDQENLINLTCSVGIVSYPQDPLFSTKEMLEAVEKSIFKVKGLGGDGIGSYIYGLIKENGKASISDKERLLEALKDKMLFFAIKGEDSILEAIHSLSKTLELKDHTTRKHADMTVHYAVKLAQKMGMNEREVEDVRRAAILHDIGKLAIPDSILLKEGPLTRSEFEIVKQHPKIAADIMSVADFLQDSIPYVLHHHEKYDGTGYPDRLKEEEIPLGASIVSIVDVYEALTSPRPYHKALGKVEAIKEIQEHSGTQFNPRIVKEFIELLSSETAA